MGSAKPWQIILIILAILALAGGLFVSCRGGVNLSDGLLMVDVETGDRFRFDTSGKKGTYVPGLNPDTQRRTLLPIVNRDGVWFLDDHFRSRLESIEGEHAAVDQSTYEVRISEASIRSGK